MSVRFDPKPTGRTWPALVPAMVGKKVPISPNGFAVTVMVEEVVAGLELKLKATPPGTFTGPRPTDPEKPLIELIVTCAEAPTPPWVMVKGARFHSCR